VRAGIYDISGFRSKICDLIPFVGFDPIVSPDRVGAARVTPVQGFQFVILR